MNMQSRDSHHRRSIRLQGYDYSQAGAYFVTICTQGRACLFGGIENDVMALNGYGGVVRDEWLKTAEIRAEIQTGEFVVMPNHFHGIVIINESSVGAIRELPEQAGAVIAVGAIHESPLQSPPRLNPVGRQQRRQMTLSKIIGRFKMLAAKRINEIRQSPGVPVWQRNYYEHVIRNEADHGQIAEYIADNPRRWEVDALHPGRL
jgi:REP element-mobilizing transposase RayT